MDNDTLIVLTPVYEDRASARMLFEDLRQHLERFRVVAIEDGSVCQPLEINDLSDAGIQGEVLHLSRNVGHQWAIAIGLSFIAQHYPERDVVVMDSDGEDRPSDIPDLTATLRESDADIVVANRGRRSEKLLFRLFYSMYKLLFALLTGRNIDFGNFMVLRPRAVKRLTKMQELWVHFPASVIVSKMRIKAHRFDRGFRYYDRSKMKFMSLVLHGMRSVMVFAEDVLVRLGMLCAIVAVGALLGISLVLILKYFGMATPGWVTMVAGFLIVILFQVGILTLITLMITGMVRGSPQFPGNQLDQYIDRTEKTS